MFSLNVGGCISKTNGKWRWYCRGQYDSCLHIDILDSGSNIDSLNSGLKLTFQLNSPKTSKNLPNSWIEFCNLQELHSFAKQSEG